MTVMQARRMGAQSLAQAGICGAQVEAQAMLCAALGVEYGSFFTHADEQLSPKTEQRYARMIGQRLSGRPAAYVCGTWEFFGLEFTVNEHVLIPRADTECLCEAALAELRGRREVHLLDLCCGSGCVGISICKTLPDARLTLSDISPQALAVAGENAARHLARASFCSERRDARQAREETAVFDAVVCNPPYVTEAEYAALSAEVREHEPRLALVGSPDGLEFYRLVPAAVRRALKPGGSLLFECGAGQAPAVAALLEGWDRVRVYRDTNGTERVVAASVPQNMQTHSLQKRNE